MNLPSPTPRRSRLLAAVEVSIVAGVLILLVGIASYRSMQPPPSSEARTARATIGALKLALKRYAADIGQYPTAEQGLAALVQRPADLPPDSGWAKPYLSTKAVPSDPWGNPYRYQYPPKHIPVDLPEVWSAGPDGRDATEDDIPSRRWIAARSTGKGGP